MRICILTDKIGSAIHEPAVKKAEILNQHDIQVCPVHPKRPSPQELDTFYNSASKSDVIDYEYWKSADMVRELYPELKEKYSILTHHNPYDILRAKNSEYDVIISPNKTMRDGLNEGGVANTLIYHGIDIDFFEYRGEYTEEKTVNMVVNRFESKKGVLPVALACKELGYKLLIVGRVSDPEYAQRVKDTGCVEFYEGISWENLRDIYYKSAIHICNSVPEFESGTLPILEAMSCGIPVVTRRIGHVPDFYNGKNAIILEKVENEDVKEIKSTLKDLMENRQKRLEMIPEGLKTIRMFSNRRRAMKYNSLYYQEHPLVSVIIPTYNDPVSLTKAVLSIEKQDYPSIEIIIADDNSDDPTVMLAVEALKKECKTSINYVNTHHEGYGLAKARNMGALKSYGEILIFLDQRFELNDIFVSEIVDEIKIKEVLYPAKMDNGKMSQKTSFLEGICAFRRKDFFDCGMFNERITEYGGMSQEIRCRLQRQDFEFRRIPSAIATQTASSRGKVKKEASIRRMKDQLEIMGMG